MGHPERSSPRVELLDQWSDEKRKIQEMERERSILRNPGHASSEHAKQSIAGKERWIVKQLC